MITMENIVDIDKSNMIDILKIFPSQVEESIKIVNDVDLSKKDYSNIVICGMGGSAIGGELLSSLVLNECRVPIFCCRDYNLPAFADENSLIICVSYSGNTEETISCFSQAKGDVITISSGGKIEELSNERGIPILKIPSGIPPRSALGYLFTIQYLVLGKLDLIDTKDLNKSIDGLNKLKEKIVFPDSISEKIAGDIKGKFPIIYGQRFYIPVARRFRTQLNENSKILAREDSFPESNHNDINGWGSADKNIVVIILRDRFEDGQVKKRIQFTKENAFKDNKVVEIFAEGESELERMLYMIYLTDFVSYYLAILRGIDPTPVGIIEKLKEHLKN